MQLVAAFCVFITLLTGSHAMLNVSNTIGSNMVLQRAPLQSQIWGWADVGASIVVSFNNQDLKTQASSPAGAWSVSLPATHFGGPYTIEITSSSGEKITLENILFGDVYLCGGQSNMQFTVDMAFNSTYEVSLADNYPNIRLFTVGQHTKSAVPFLNLASIEQNWTVASSGSVGGGNWSYISAVCWFFGRDLYDHIQVPIGLISNNYGGTFVQAWSSPAVIAQCNATIPPFNATAGPNQPTCLYNAMIHPFFPQTIAGVVWYQGEQNIYYGTPELYECLIQAMITDWRASFGSGYKFPFLFVHLAPWIGDVSISLPVAEIRNAQLAALNLDGVGYASAIDLGDPLSPFDSIHPRNKQDVAKRLLLAARNVAYGEWTVAWEGPRVLSAMAAGVQNQTAIIMILFALQGKPGIYSRNTTCPELVPSNLCANFEILLSDSNWYPADYVLAMPTANVVTIDIKLPNPSLTAKGVRYGYSLWPVTTLYSYEGLPAVPFEYLF